MEGLLQPTPRSTPRATHAMTPHLSTSGSCNLRGFAPATPFVAILAFATFAGGWSRSASAVPPRFFARPVEGVQYLCNPSDPSSSAAVHGVALANDGRVACVAQCGTTSGGARPFVVMPTGDVVPYAHGTFTFATPAGFRPDGELLLIGDWCPPVSGTCTTAVASSVPAALGNVAVLASSSVTTSVANDVEETGWAVGWGATSVSGAWRVRPDGGFESLEMSGAGGVDVWDVSPSGVAVGSAYVGGSLQALRWSPTSSASILPPLKAGLPTQALAVGLDGTAAGSSGGRAVWWFANGTVTPLLPAGSQSEATAIAGHSAAANPLGFAIFGTHAGGTRMFRAIGPSVWTDLGPFDASAQFNNFRVVSAPQPDLMLAHAQTTLYQLVPFVWTFGDSLRRLDRMIVNLDLAALSNIEVVDANASGTVLINTGTSLAPYTLTRLEAGDTDGDGRVNGADLARLLATWGAVPAGIRGAADFDGDGDVDAGDLGFLLSQWG